MPVWKEWGQGNPEALIFHFSTDGPSQLAAGPVAPRQLRYSDEICPLQIPPRVPALSALPLCSPRLRPQHESIPRSRGLLRMAAQQIPEVVWACGAQRWCWHGQALIRSHGTGIALRWAGRRHSSGERERCTGSVQPPQTPSF